MNKKYTSNGCRVRILCVDGYDADYPVVVMYEDSSIGYFTENGINADDKREMWDLVEEWAPKRGEWCLFTDETFTGAMLMQFLTYSISGRFHAMGATNSFGQCTKFTGELPKSLKAV
jgi:hypothetical protein